MSSAWHIRICNILYLMFTILWDSSFILRKEKKDKENELKLYACILDISLRYVSLLDLR